MDFLNRLVASIALVFAFTPATCTLAQDWSRSPEPADMVRYYPEFARNLGLEGWASLSCDVTASGELTGCSVVEAVPAGLGFDSAALRLAPLFRMRATATGEALNRKARVPIKFVLPPSTPRPPAPPPTSEAALAAAREMVAVDDFSRMRLRERFESQAYMLETMDLGDDDPKVRRIAVQAFRDAAANAELAMLESYAQTYAAFETEEELRAEIAFRRSVGGRANVAAGPSLRLANRQALATMQEVVHLRAKCERAVCEPVEAQRLADIRRMRASEATRPDQMATARRIAEAEHGGFATAYAARLSRVERPTPQAARAVSVMIEQEQAAAIETLAKFYARTFTPEELFAIATLKAGPAGASIRAKGDKLYAAFARLDDQDREQVLADTRVRFCAQRPCSADDQTRTLARAPARAPPPRP